MALDWKRQRLYVAALGSDRVDVVDLRAGRDTRRITGLKEPQGIAYCPAPDRLFVASGEGGRCDVYDGGSLRHLTSVPGLEDADNVRCGPPPDRVYVGYGTGGLRVLNAGTGAKLGDVPLAGHPESFQLEKKGTRIFVNVPSARQVAVIDRNALRKLAKWPLSSARANFPLVLDEAHHRLFVGCREPAVVLVLDTETGHQVALVGIGGDTDDLFYDTSRRLLYASCGEGSVSVIRQTDADHYAVVARVPTAAEARTSLFVPESGRLYVAVPHRGGQQAELLVLAPS
jgi:DNA-binding beta-propeller fold protein YncE